MLMQQGDCQCVVILTVPHILRDQKHSSHQCCMLQMGVEAQVTGLRLVWLGVLDSRHISTCNTASMHCSPLSTAAAQLQLQNVWSMRVGHGSVASTVAPRMHASKPEVRCSLCSCVSGESSCSETGCGARHHGRLQYCCSGSLNINASQNALHVTLLLTIQHCAAAALKVPEAHPEVEGLWKVLKLQLLQTGQGGDVYHACWTLQRQRRKVCAGAQRVRQCPAKVTTSVGSGAPVDVKVAQLCRLWSAETPRY